MRWRVGWIVHREGEERMVGMGREREREMVLLLTINLSTDC
jgi:hypothetical protein